jgi:hypothetical protein
MKKIVRIWLRCFATASIIAGPIFGLIATGFAIHTSTFIRHASRTEGTVNKLTAYKDEDTTETFAPTFTFSTPSGETISKESSTRSSPPSFAVVDHVPVLFDPNNPQHAEIGTPGQLWFIPILFGSFFLAFTTAGILLLNRPQIRAAPLPFFSSN